MLGSHVAYKDIVDSLVAQMTNEALPPAVRQTAAHALIAINSRTFGLQQNEVVASVVEHEESGEGGEEEELDDDEEFEEDDDEEGGAEEGVGEQEEDNLSVQPQQQLH
jgi:Ran GTPase-activating protein (RanGAP) involved in mRNA processing and transport